MKKNNRYAGYINLKPINEVLYPSSIQNILMKAYVTEKLKGKFYLSPTEVLQAKFSITLNTLLDSNIKIKGIVMLSSFSLPSNFENRMNIYKKALKTRKELYFIFDEIVFKGKKDIEKIEDYLIFRDNFFTDTKLSLLEHEKKYLRNFKQSFV